MRAVFLPCVSSPEGRPTIHSQPATASVFSYGVLLGKAEEVTIKGSAASKTLFLKYKWNLFIFSVAFQAGILARS